MMTLFDTGLSVILFLSVIFFCIFTYACLMWTGRSMTKLQNILGATVVSFLHTFQIILLSVSILGLVQIIVNQVF